MKLNDKIFIAGHNGLVGSAILRQLKIRGFKNLLIRSHDDLELTNQALVLDFFNILYNNYNEIRVNILIARAVPILLIIS